MSSNTRSRNVTRFLQETSVRASQHKEPSGTVHFLTRRRAAAPPHGTRRSNAAEQNVPGRLPESVHTITRQGMPSVQLPEASIASTLSLQRTERAVWNAWNCRSAEHFHNARILASAPSFGSCVVLAALTSCSHCRSEPLCRRLLCACPRAAAEKLRRRCRFHRRTLTLAKR